MAREKCTVYQEVCREHHFVHGGEAQELRHGIEKIIAWLDQQQDEDSISALTALPGELRADLQDLLDEVDARDSLAFIEADAEEDEEEEGNEP